MKKILFVILTFVSTYGYSQERVNREQPIISKPVSKLKKAKGWCFTEYDGKWFERNNAIHSIDDFTEFSFSKIVYKGKEYLYLRKGYKAQGYKYDLIKANPYQVGMHIDFVFDIIEYKKAIENITTSDNELRIKLVYFGRSFPNGFLSNKNPDTEYELLLKFRLNEKEKYARFFICALRYYTFINSYDNKVTTTSIDGLTETVSSENDEILRILTYNDIFTKYYYECKFDNFLKFIITPTE